jgi:quinone-reactive Ni/Fe-hydrogenase large subunit
LVSYLQNNTPINGFVDEFLQDTQLQLEDLSSTIGRNCARAIESLYVSEYIFKLLSQLLQNIKYYDTQTWTSYEFETLHKNSMGNIFLEVPRGVLYHGLNIKEGKIKNYQVIAPTTWNATPKNYDGKRGAYEEALIGIKLQDPSKPLEVLKVLHSFDPCLACAVHIIDTCGKSLGQFKLSTAQL